MDSINTKEWAGWFNFDLRENRPDREHQQMIALINAAARFVLAVRSGSGTPHWLSLLGKSGAGKTMVAKRIWRWFKQSELFRSEVHKRGQLIIYPGQWCYWPNVASELQANSGYGWLEDLATEKLVVFDEIGSERDVSAHVRDCLARTLCARVGKWTIITSNKTLHNIAADIDARVASRMIRDGSVVVELDVPDYALTPTSEKRIKP